MNTSLFGYFKHQFVASPLRRFLWIVPLIAVLSLGTFFVDSALASALHPVLLTVLVLVALQEEETVYSAYGIPRSRAVKLTAFAVVPSVVFGAAVSLAARPDWVGVAGAVGALVAGLVTGSRYIDGEVPDPIRVRRSQFGERGYTFELIFKPQLLWAFGVALAHSGMLHLASHIGGETLRDYLGALPLLAWYAVYCMADSPIVGPGVGAAYGGPAQAMDVAVPRRCRGICGALRRRGRGAFARYQCGCRCRSSRRTGLRGGGPFAQGAQQ